MIQFILNNNEVKTDQKHGLLLLDYIRYYKNLKGTKIGCREGDCGACTVLIGEIIDGKLQYQSVTSCLTPIGNVNGKHVVTIEGINMETLSPVQQAMSDEAATQCGFCTVGIVMSLTGFCLNYHSKNNNAIASIDGNICRCTGYKSIERAANSVENLMQLCNSNTINFLVENKYIPNYFSNVESKLLSLNSVKNNVSKISESSYFVGGGTDLYVQKHDTMVDANIIFLSENENIKDIYIQNNFCYIGSAATVSNLLESETINKYFPDFKHYAKLISSTPIRNIATVGGNFTNASPIGDLTILFLALNATLIISNGIDKRELALKNYFLSYKKLNKLSNEFIEKVYFELPNSNTQFNFEKVSKRTHLDIASVNTAIKIEVINQSIKSIIITAGGVGPVPLILEKTCNYLLNKKIDSKIVIESLEILQTEIAPIGDTRGSEKYKRLLINQLIKAHFIKLFNLFLQ